MLWHTIPDGGADGETEREERERERIIYSRKGHPPLPFELKGSRAEEET